MNAENGRLEMETSSTPLGIVLMDDLGDHQTFGVDGVDTLSACNPRDVRPNGIIAGVNMGSPAASGANNAVDVATVVAMIKGIKTPVAAVAGQVIARPVGGDVAQISSVTVNEAGAVAVVTGAEAADAIFLATRGVAGGPPLIPVDSIELFQVRLNTQADAPITVEQIVHTTEFAEAFEIDETGRGDHEENPLRRRAHVRFGRVLPQIHTGPATRRVYIDARTPDYTEISKAADFTPAEESVSSSSSQHYGGVETDDSVSLGQGKFKAKLNNGVSDMILASRKKVRTFRFFPDRDQPEHVVTQGKVATARTFPVASGIAADVTISARRASAEYFIE